MAFELPKVGFYQDPHTLQGSVVREGGQGTREKLERDFSGELAIVASPRRETVRQ